MVADQALHASISPNQDYLLHVADERMRRQLERNEYVRGNGGGGGVYGAVTNVLVIGGFAAFALIVQYVLQNIATQSD